MEYHDQSLQFINNYYFHLKTEEDEHYKIIKIIFEGMGYFNLVLFAAALFLSFAYFLPKINIIIQKLLKIQIYQLMLKKYYSNKSSNNDNSSNGNSNNKNSNAKSKKRKKSKNSTHVSVEIDSIENEKKEMESRINEKYKMELPNYTQNGKCQQNVYILSIFLTSALINLFLFAFHVISSIIMLQYVSEVQNSGYTAFYLYKSL